MIMASFQQIYEAMGYRNLQKVAEKPNATSRIAAIAKLMTIDPQNPSPVYSVLFRYR
jgi:hypothetical protein